MPGEQVNSDWNATEGPAEILNKPTIIEGVLFDLTDVSTEGSISLSAERYNPIYNSLLAGNDVYLKVKASGMTSQTKVILFNEQFMSISVGQTLKLVVKQ